MIINILLLLFRIIYYTLLKLIKNLVLFIFYIYFDTKLNLLTNLYKVLKYFLKSTRLYAFLHLIATKFFCIRNTLDSNQKINNSSINLLYDLKHQKIKINLHFFQLFRA